MSERERESGMTHMMTDDEFRSSLCIRWEDRYTRSWRQQAPDGGKRSYLNIESLVTWSQGRTYLTQQNILSNARVNLCVLRLKLFYLVPSFFFIPMY